MASVETQESSAKSPQLQTTDSTSDTETENKKLLSVSAKQNNPIDTANMVESKLTTGNTTDSIKDIDNDINCDKMKDESKNEVTQLETNDKKEINCNTENDVNKSVIVSPTSVEDSKVHNSDNLNETAAKGGNNLKRKRRTLVTQESDPIVEENSPRSKRKKTKNANDQFCWRCHKESVEAYCSACPRSWHRKCIGGVQPLSMQNWICGECATILKAENAETRSAAMAQLSVDQLCLLLRHVVERMRDYPGSQPFWEPVKLAEAPSYLDYVVKPMDLSLLESNVRAKLYGSTDAFMADAKWIQHNCIVFNTCGGVYTDTSKLTNAAKQIIKMARQEVSEIEACPDCYAHGRNLPRPQPSWFIEPCRQPHPLVWAKLKGFPFWPAKAMPRTNSQGFVDVRFFGEHDRAWVSPRDLYLYSEEPPAPLPRKRKLDMDECVREITRHCRKLELAFGHFQFAPPKVQYNPHDPTQIKLLLPNYDPLHPNNCVSSQFLSPKKKPAAKKRTVTKTKSQNDLHKTDSSDMENKTLNNSDVSSLCDTSNERSEIEVKDSKTLKSEKCGTKLTPIASSNLSIKLEPNDLIKSEDVPKTALNKNKAKSMLVKNEDLKPGPSKVNNTNDVKTTEHNAYSPSIKILERKNSFQKAVPEIKFIENSSKPVTSSVQNSLGNVQNPKKESITKNNVNKADTNQSLSNAQKNGMKLMKNVAKVYKPKTRMVDKLNAERALKSISGNEQNQKLSTEETTVKVSPVQTDSLQLKDISNTSDSSLIPASLSMSSANLQNDTSNSQISTKTSADQSLALFLVVNSGVSDAGKQSISVTDKQRLTDVSAVQQAVKDVSHVPHQKRESKARKSFPNKARSYQQLVSQSTSNQVSNSSDSMVYVPVHQAEHYTGYQMLPPEAGPVSARLYNSAQDLAKRMAQLMEEAYKEAAQESQNCEGGSSENHQATVHFLRLQMERMRWQHQQQLAELKHNTDRILREMRTSLEAERVRAIEETRREAEIEQARCIEETKRKQWCAMCGHEALFYCCWNTAYCDYPCQQSHWPTHMKTCAQQPSFSTIVTSSAATSNQQQVMPRLMIHTQHVPSNVWRA